DLSRGDLFHELAQRVKQAANANVRAREVRAVHAPVSPDQTFSPNGKLVAIGASTGGVEALQTFLGDYPENCPATLIVQHMPESFLPQFADRLNASCRARVEIAADGAPLRSGRVYVAPGGADHLEVSGRVERVCRLAQGDLIEGHRPSVDALFGSIARVSGGSAIGVLLTGMGRDGAAGLKAMRDAGAYTLVQDEVSCTVYGMPRAAMALNAAVKEAPLERLAPLVLAAAAATKESV
ncbi:MAG: chemotaxis protein CheB, partial [Pseudomonadota bacterium]